jgi:hypothetical protein
MATRRRRRWHKPPDRLDLWPGEDVIACNICKALAVSVGLVWNFCFYKFFVYAV